MTGPARFDVVAFDADDTLWRSEDSFHAAEQRFVELLGPHAPEGVDVAAALSAIERANLSISGYGVKAFTLSMIEAAISISGARVPASVIDELLTIGREMLTEHVHLLPHVPEVLAEVGRHHRLVLITKGDLVHQTRKITTSGLEHHFDHVEVVLEKDPDTYQRIVDHLDVAADRFCMVGNSVRSDVLPVLEIGGHAVHVPYHLTWAVEHVEHHDADFAELASIADVPRWLAGAA
ncbi:MAG: HAD family hydrolase [Ilumatobacteraceae bacterium]|nr:HAD family hydrolase [Ilumatobacteraceae bacterium]